MSMLIEQVNELKKVSVWYKESNNYLQKVLLQAADTIETLSAKLAKENMERSDRYYNGGWVLRNDRLPEVYKPVLINYHRESDNFDKIAVAYMRSDCEWKIEFGGVCDCESVIAWQPLPELYKPK